MEVDELKYALRQKEVPSSASDLLMLMEKYGEALANVKAAIELLINIGSSIAGCENVKGASDLTPDNTGGRSRIFFRLRFWMYNWIIFYNKQLNWEFLLKRYNFFKTFVETDFLLCTTISIDFNSEISFPLC